MESTARRRLRLIRLEQLARVEAEKAEIEQRKKRILDEARASLRDRALGKLQGLELKPTACFAYNGVKTAQLAFLIEDDFHVRAYGGGSPSLEAWASNGWRAFTTLTSLAPWVDTLGRSDQIAASYEPFPLRGMP